MKIKNARSKIKEPAWRTQQDSCVWSKKREVVSEREFFMISTLCIFILTLTLCIGGMFRQDVAGLKFVVSPVFLLLQEFRL